MAEMDSRLVSFVAEYRALCERHGLVISYDGGNLSFEVSVLLAGDLTDDSGWRYVV